MAPDYYELTCKKLLKYGIKMVNTAVQKFKGTYYWNDGFPDPAFTKISEAILRGNEIIVEWNDSEDGEIDV